MADPIRKQVVEALLKLQKSVKIRQTLQEQSCINIHEIEVLGDACANIIENGRMVLLQDLQQARYYDQFKKGVRTP